MPGKDNCDQDLTDILGMSMCGGDNCNHDDNHNNDDNDNDYDDENYIVSFKDGIILGTVMCGGDP